MARDLRKSAAYVVLYTAVVSAAFTFAIMGLNAASQGRVKANEKLLFEKAIVDLFALGDVARLSAGEIAALVQRRVAGYTDPGGDARDPRRRPLSISDPQTSASIPLLVAFREDLASDRPIDIRDPERILGYAFPVGGQGFWAPIEGWLAVSPDLAQTLGIVFLEHSETPGLGGRISEAEFRDQFRPAQREGGKGLTTAPPPAGEAWIVIDQQRPERADPAYARHVVAITGATGTSAAVAAFLNEDLARFHRAARAAGMGTGS